MAVTPMLPWTQSPRLKPLMSTSRGSFNIKSSSLEGTCGAAVASILQMKSTHFNFDLAQFFTNFFLPKWHRREDGINIHQRRTSRLSFPTPTSGDWPDSHSAGSRLDTSCHRSEVSCWRWRRPCQREFNDHLSIDCCPHWPMPICKGHSRNQQ